MKTRKISAIIALLLCVSMLAACGSYNYDLSEYATLGQFEGVEIEAEAIDAQLQMTVDSFISSNTTTTEVTDRAAKDGDVLNIDYAGTIDGVAFSGGTASAQTLTIGEGGYIEGFEEGLIGAKTGETVTLDLKFPEDYGNEELNGKEAVFTVTVNSISEKIVPELTDALIAEKTDYATVDEYKAAKRLVIKQNLVWDKISASSTIIKYPEKEVKKYYDSMIDGYKMYASMYGVTLESYVYQTMGISDMSQFSGSLIATAKNYVKNDILGRLICEAKGLELTDAEYDRISEMFAKENGYESAKAMEEAAGKDSVKNNALLQLAVEFAGNAAVETAAE